MTEQEKQQRKLITRLEVNESFIAWRDLAVKPVLDQLEYQLQTPLEMNEANLKATVMYRNLVRGLFIDLFPNIAAELKANSETAKMVIDK